MPPALHPRLRGFQADPHVPLAAASFALTPASSVRLVKVTLDSREVATPDGENFAAVVREALLELACLLAGPLHTPEDRGACGLTRMRQDVSLQGSGARRVGEVPDEFADSRLDPGERQGAAERLAAPALLAPVRFGARCAGRREVWGRAVEVVLARHPRRPA